MSSRSDKTPPHPSFIIVIRSPQIPITRTLFSTDYCVSCFSCYSPLPPLPPHTLLLFFSVPACPAAFVGLVATFWDVGLKSSCEGLERGKLITTNTPIFVRCSYHLHAIQNSFLFAFYFFEYSVLMFYMITHLPLQQTN